MTLLADTSVAVPLVMASHAAHVLVDRTVGARPVHLAGHAAFETYAVLTRLPGDARLAPADAAALLAERFVGVVSPAADPLDDLLPDFASLGIAGGATYDALVARAVLAAPDGVLLSRDLRAAATYARLGVAVELVGG